MVWVVSNAMSGYSDESMRFAEWHDAEVFIEENQDDERDVFFDKRWESDSPHPQNHVALGQIWRDGGWLDYARDTPEAAIRWAQREPVALARVVDWVSREVMWP
jgi:hypothetical protein